MAWSIEASAHMHRNKNRVRIELARVDGKVMRFYVPPDGGTPQIREFRWGRLNARQYKAAAKFLANAPAVSPESRVLEG